MTVVCSTCNDTHAMSLHGAVVMCTKCPTPCQSCRSDGIGPYCEATPCSCSCHHGAARPLTDRERLLELYSVAANSNVELVIFQKDEPDAVAALHAWAMSVERKIHTQDLDICGMVTWVETGERRRSIQVYTLPSRAA